MYVQFVVKIDLVQYQVFVLLYVWMVYYAHVPMYPTHEHPSGVHLGKKIKRGGAELILTYTQFSGKGRHVHH